MWQMQIFWGFTPDHECINNGTDYVLQPCGTENGTSCDYVMDSSYVSDFGLFCNDAKYLKFMQSAMLFGSFFGELLLGSLQDTASRAESILERPLEKFSNILYVEPVKGHNRQTKNNLT